MGSTAASTAARERSPWSVGARSETGYVRKANEDRMGWMRTSFGDVYVVSDGMGGYKGGALASELTVSALQQSLAQLAPHSKRFTEKVRQAFLDANDAVYQRRDPNDPNTREMGATAVVLIISGSRFMIAHVGDSRAYRWHWFPGLRRLTKDHTRVQKLVDEGVVKEADAENHPDAGLLSRAIGYSSKVEVEISPWRRARPGDVLLLCSDGLSAYVSDREINAVLRSGKGPRWTANALVQKALDKGGEDNVTVQLLRYAPHEQDKVMMTRMLALGAALCAVAFLFVAVELRNISGQLQELERIVKSPGQHTASAPAEQTPAGESTPSSAAQSKKTHSGSQQ